MAMRARTSRLAMGVMVLTLACDKATPSTPSDTGKPDATKDGATTADGTGGDLTKPETAADAPATPETAPVPDTAPAPEATGAEATPEATPPAGANCLEISDCLFAACAGKTGVEASACLAEKGLDGSCPAPANPEETVAATALGTCMVEHECELGYAAKRYECQRSKCLLPSVACAAQTHAAQMCYKLTSCIYLCEDDITGYEDYACERGCYDTGAEDELKAFLDLRMCVTEACYDKNGWTTAVTMKQLLQCVQNLPESFCDQEGSKCTQFGG